MPRTAHDREARRKLNQAETYDPPCGSSSHRDVQVSTGHQIYCCAVASPPLQLWPPGVRHPLQVAPPRRWTSAARHPATGPSGERGTLRPPDARRLAPNFIVQDGPRRRPRSVAAAAAAMAMAAAADSTRPAGSSETQNLSGSQESEDSPPALPSPRAGKQNKARRDPPATAAPMYVFGPSPSPSSASTSI